MEELRPDITQATDHQRYLSDLFKHLKSKNKAFSHAYFAKRLSVAPSYLKNIFSKRRVLNLELVGGLAALFRLSAFETQFLTVLVVRDHIIEKDIRNYFEGVLGSLRFESRHLKKGPIFEVQNESPDLLDEDPVLHLLHSFVKIKDFRPEADWVRACLSNSNITNEQITIGYKKLLKKGFLEEKEGRYIVKEDFIFTGNAFDFNSSKTHRSSMHEVDQALENVLPFKPYGFASGHFIVNKEGASQISKAFYDFYREAMEIEKKCSNPDRVIGVSNSFLTLARTDKLKKRTVNQRSLAGTDARR